MQNHIHLLVENYKEDLKKCVVAITEENEMKDVPTIGAATLTQLLSEVCSKLNAKGLFYINNRKKLLPLAPAVNTVYSKLKKGEQVELTSEDYKVKITAQTINEFLEKLLQFLM